MADPVFVQPHYDDIALSCGGTVAQLAEESTPLIATVCGGTPGDNLSGFAHMQHERWNLDAASVVFERQREDACAARMLGESVRTVSLDICDAIYRDPAYASEELLFGQLQQDDWMLVDELAEKLARLGDTFVIPLGIGNHVDHQLTFAAGLELQRGGRTVWFYADLPYALQEDALAARLGDVNMLETCERPQSSESLDRRWKAVECYASQLPVIFRTIENPRESFENFASSSDGASVERFWRIAGGTAGRE